MLRPETTDDRAFLLDLFMQSRPSLQLLPEAARTTLVPMQFQAQTNAIRAQYPNATYAVVLRDGEPIGRIVCELGGPVLHLVDIALRSDLRRRGYGTALIRAVMDDARAAGADVSLSVADGNPAAHLYRRLGFEPVGRSGTDTTMVWRSGSSAA